MDAEPARLIIEALKEEKIDLSSPAEPPDRRVGFFIKSKTDLQFCRCCTKAPAIEKVG